MQLRVVETILFVLFLILLALHPAILWPGVVALIRVSSMRRIKLFNQLLDLKTFMLNSINNVE